MNKFAIGDTVFVPFTKLGIEGNGPSALHRTTVLATKDRSVQVDLPGGAMSEWIGSSLVSSNVGIAIVRVGDYGSEATLLDPLAKSTLQFARLLLADDYVTVWNIRSREELRELWCSNHGALTHVVLVGHGGPTGLKFGVNGMTTPEDLSRDLVCAEEELNVEPKEFISLACSTGYKAFGAAFSQGPACSAFIAPFHSVHGATASQFVQTYLSYRLLKGSTLKTAFNNARSAVTGIESFRMWRDGKLQGGPKLRA